MLGHNPANFTETRGEDRPSRGQGFEQFVGRAVLGIGVLCIEAVKKHVGSPGVTAYVFRINKAQVVNVAELFGDSGEKARRFVVGRIRLDENSHGSRGQDSGAATCW